MSLNDASVLVAGGGFAGLSAAHELVKRGASVTVIEARDRPGGRVWTIRDGFVDGQHAEAGGDLIDEAQQDIRRLAGELGLPLVRILKGGFGYARTDGAGKVGMISRSTARGWSRLEASLSEFTDAYRLAESRWDSPIAAAIARRSVAEWLNDINADSELRTSAAGLRGFFLADPDDLSLIAVVDQFAGNEAAGEAFYRIKGGNDRLAQAIAGRLGDRIRYGTELVAITSRGREVRASLRHARSVTQSTFEYVVLALPATTVRRIPITPALPTQQHDAIARLKYGRATKSLLQFTTRFWRAAGRPRAFGTDLPIGAVWEGNEEHRGRGGILTLLAGGGASDATGELIARHGMQALADSLDWLGSRGAALVGSKQMVWENDPWARGGYAYFDPAYDAPLRPWLARPAGRLFFAGEHTSMRWQGYMNGAIQSGRRAAAEVDATHRLATPPGA